MSRTNSLTAVTTVSLVTLVFVSLHTVRESLAYNIDSLVPTLTRSGIAEGTETLFGYSVAQHAFSNGSYGVLVGDPLANMSTFNREGGVYFCPIDTGGECSFQDVFLNTADARGSPFVPNELSAEDESYTNNFMGYTVRSFETSVAACAPMYLGTINDDNAYIMNGRCVILPQEWNSTTSPKHISDSTLTNSQFGGTDIKRLDDVNYVVGAPFTGLGGLSSGFGAFYSAFLNSDPYEASPSPDVNVAYAALLGYDVEYGYFTESVLQIASSAPKGANHKGNIMVMNAPANAGEQLQMNNLVESPEGNGYFGYSFAVFAWGDHQYHSLVVGCPLCDQENGKVYVYLHSGSTADPYSAPVVLDSPREGSERFGMGVENVGDLDQDGYEDVAISAPYDDGTGSVYIYRGSRNGLVTSEYQRIPGVAGSKYFGFQVSSGLDVDGNGYPDITISDLSGSQVTTYRSSPLVEVNASFSDLVTSLDFNRKDCTLSSGVTVTCFVVQPCFVFASPVQLSPVDEFAVRYTLVVDKALSRVLLLDSEGKLTENSVEQDITLTGANTLRCTDSFQFAFRPDIINLSPVTVSISLQDIEEPLQLASDGKSDSLGGALHPILKRYVQGDIPVLPTTKNISISLDCTTNCTPAYEVSLNLEGGNGVPVLLSDDQVIVVNVEVNNTGDAGLGTSLVARYPPGIRFSNEEQDSRAVQSCQSESPTLLRCFLQNPIPNGAKLGFALNFLFNLSSIELNTTSVDMTFDFLDGPTGNVITSSSLNVRLEAVASYVLSASLGADQYKANTISLSQPLESTPLDEIGPTITYTVVVQNPRKENSGTTIPESQLVIYWPTYTYSPTAEGFRDYFLIPVNLLSPRAECIQYNATPPDLSPLHRNFSFINFGTGNIPDQPPPSCVEGGVDTCGVIYCSIANLSPLSAVRIDIQGILWSPSVREEKNVTVNARVESRSSFVKFIPTGREMAEATTRILPEVNEIQVNCFPFWIIIVSVAAALAFVIILVIVLACLGLFRQWHKHRKEFDLQEAEEETDDQNDFVYRTRTVPPIPGVNDGGGAVAVSYKSKEEEEKERKAREKEAEAEKELQQQLQLQASMVNMPSKSLSVSPSNRPLNIMDDDLDLNFDPHEGVDEDEEGGETEL